MERKAWKSQHSTAAMAGEFARRIEASLLVLTHFSSRYSQISARAPPAKPSEVCPIWNSPSPPSLHDLAVLVRAESKDLTYSYEAFLPRLALRGAVLNGSTFSDHLILLEACWSNLASARIRTNPCLLFELRRFLECLYFWTFPYALCLTCLITFDRSSPAWVVLAGFFNSSLCSCSVSC